MAKSKKEKAPEGHIALTGWTRIKNKLNSGIIEVEKKEHRIILKDNERNASRIGALKSMGYEVEA